MDDNPTGFGTVPITPPDVVRERVRRECECHANIGYAGKMSDQSITPVSEGMV